MLGKSAPKEDRSAPVTDGPLWRVVAVAVLPDYQLHVRFADGVEGEVDMAELVRSPKAGVFAALADPDIFARVFIEHGATTWPGEVDLAPDAMYVEIKKSGRWVLN
jgi:hypothetical protein